MNPQKIGVRVNIDDAQLPPPKKSHIGCAKFKMINGHKRMLAGTQQYCNSKVHGQCPLNSDVEECQKNLLAMGLELLEPMRVRINKFQESKELEIIRNHKRTQDEGAPVDFIPDTNPPATAPTGFEMETVGEGKATA